MTGGGLDTCCARFGGTGNGYRSALQRPTDRYVVVLSQLDSSILQHPSSGLGIMSMIVASCTSESS